MPELNEELDLLRRIKNKVMDHMSWSEKRFNIWWTAKNMNFGGITPKRLYELGRGQKVESFIDTQLRESTYSPNRLNIVDEETCFHIIEKDQIITIPMDGWTINEFGTISTEEGGQIVEHGKYSWFSDFDECLMCYHKQMKNYSTFKRRFDKGLLNIRKRR